MPARRPLDPDLYADVVAEAKQRFDVWPSAYASGWVVRTYKARGGRYAGGDKKARGARSTGLTKWFGEEWVDLSRPIHDEDGQLVGYEPCGRRASDDPAAYPKCRPLKEAMRMTPDEVKDAIRRKRMAEAKAAKGRGGRGARAPVRVSTYRANPVDAHDARERFLDATTPEDQIVALAAWHAADPNDVARNHPSPSFAKREFTPEFFTMFAQAVNDGDAEAIEAITNLHNNARRRLRPSDEQRAQKRAEQEAERYERQGVEIDTSARNPLAKLKGRGKRVWLYHGTSSLFLDDILRNGLRPSMEHGQTSNVGAKTFAKASPEYVFLTASPRGTASAEFYAKYAARQHGGEPVVLRVLVDADELAYDPDDADLSVGRTQFVIDHVDPQQIKEVDGVRVGSPSARANPRFTDIPNVLAVVDTADVHSYDDAYVFGRAATFDDELGVVGWHVTDDPDVVLDKIERGIDFKKAYGSKGQTSELGPGLYVSAVPHFWAARSTKKWAFVGTLGPEQRQAVLAALRAEIESDARRGRITEREAATAFRYLDTAEQTDDLRPLTILASLPYSIAWHKPAWLEDVGVVGAHPQAVKVALSGKFARLEHSYPSPDTLRALRRAGFAGAFTTGGAGANPELVVFHGASVTPLGIEDVE